MNLPTGSPPLPKEFDPPLDGGEFPLEPGLRVVWVKGRELIALSFWASDKPLLLDKLMKHETRGEDTDTEVLKREQGLYWVEDRGSLAAWKGMAPASRWSDGTLDWSATYGNHYAGGGVEIYFRIELRLKPGEGRATWIHTHVVRLP